MSRKQEHAELVEFAIGEYEDAFIAAIAEVTENGEVIGMARVSKRTLRGFFDKVSPQEWYAASITDPEGAQAMLNEYVEAST